MRLGLITKPTCTTILPRIERTKPDSNPIKLLELYRGWWQGKIATRRQFADQDRLRAQRFLEMSASGEPVGGSTNELVALGVAGDPERQRDASFAAVAAAERCHAIADGHENAISEYQARMGLCTN